MHVDYFSTNGEHVGLLSCYDAHVWGLEPCTVILSAAARRVILTTGALIDFFLAAAASTKCRRRRRSAVWESGVKNVGHSSPMFITSCTVMYVMSHPTCWRYINKIIISVGKHYISPSAEILHRPTHRRSFFVVCSLRLVAVTVAAHRSPPCVRRLIRC